jgi:hypothetical protein
MTFSRTIAGLFVGAIALLGISASALPAAAATLGLDFASTPGSFFSQNVLVDGWKFDVTASGGITVTALGTFDGGPTGNPVQSGSLSNLPYAVTVDLFNSTGSVLATTTVGGSTTTGQTQNGLWGFNAITPLALAAGTYYVASLIPGDTCCFTGDANQSQAVPVTLGPGIAFDQSEQCVSTTMSTCSLANILSYGGTTDNTIADAGWFGGNFEYTSVSATPLPGALSLFAGGLGALGLLARRRKRKGVPAAA